MIVGGKPQFRDGALAPPDGPGLGVTLDRTALAKLHGNYINCGIRRRDDGQEMRKYDPNFSDTRPRF